MSCFPYAERAGTIAQLLWLRDIFFLIFFLGIAKGVFFEGLKGRAACLRDTRWAISVHGRAGRWSSKDVK